MNELEYFKLDNRGQTSVEVILLIGSILVISIICGTYIYKINLEINDLFNETLSKGRLFLCSSRRHVPRSRQCDNWQPRRPPADAPHGWEFR